MLATIFGIVGLVLALFCVGGFMEGDMAKVGKSGAGLVVCAVLILFTSSPNRNSGGSQDCHIEWDGFSNPEVCD